MAIHRFADGGEMEVFLGLTIGEVERLLDERSHNMRGATLVKNTVDPPPAQKPENIDHPPHYGGDTVYEAIKVIEAWNLNFRLGNSVKYIRRAFVKHMTRAGTLDDLRKARWYLDREIVALGGEELTSPRCHCDRFDLERAGEVISAVDGLYVHHTKEKCG